MNELTQCMSEMEETLLDLSIQLQACADPKLALFFDMPRITVEQEEGILEHGYQRIEVNEIKGAEALEKCKEAFSDWYVYDESLSRRYLHKYPGLVVVSDPAAFARVQGIVEALNEQKKRFRALVQKEGTDFEKWQAVHDRFSYIITMAIYRGIQCFDAEFDAMYFNWVTRKRSQRFSRQELLDKLERSKAQIPIGRDPRLWTLQVEEEIASIESSHYPSFSARRVINYRPEVNLRIDGTMQSVSAGLPIIVSSLPKRITPLETLDVAERQKQTREKGHWELLIPRMHLYANVKSMSGLN